MFKNLLLVGLALLKAMKTPTVAVEEIKYMPPSVKQLEPNFDAYEIPVYTIVILNCHIIKSTDSVQ
jgi:hypothetical protein